MKNPPSSPQHNNSSRLQEYLKYSGMAIEMLVIIGIFTFAGYKIDSLLDLKFPLGTITGSVSGLALALFRITKSLNSK